MAALRAFVAVVEAGGFSAASSALNLSQPSISAQVQNLEEACGFRLLHRRRRLELTEDGRVLLVRARLALSRIDEFARAAGDITALRSGRLVLGFSTPAFAMPLLAQFTRAFPGVEIATRIGNTATLLTDLAECRADVAVMSCPAPPPEHETVVIARDRLGLVVRTGDPLTRRRLRIDDPAIEPMVQREPGSMTRSLFEAGRDAAGADTARGIEVGSREALKEAVAAGLGHGVLFAGETGADPRLRFVPFHDPELTALVCAVCLREMRAVPTVASFLDLASRRSTEFPGGRGPAGRTVPRSGIVDAPGAGQAATGRRQAAT